MEYRNCRYLSSGEYLCKRNPRVEKFSSLSKKCKDNVVNFHNIVKENIQVTPNMTDSQRRDAQNKINRQKNIINKYRQCKPTMDGKTCLPDDELFLIKSDPVFDFECNKCCPPVNPNINNQTQKLEEEKGRTICTDNCRYKQCLKNKSEKLCKRDFEFKKANKENVKDKSCLAKYVSKYRCYDENQPCYNSFINMCLEQEKEKEAKKPKNT